MQKTILFSSKAHEPLCTEIASLFPLFIERGKITWDVFDDGFSKTFIHDVENVMHRDVCFLASFEKEEDIFKQLGAVHALPHYGALSLKIVLPYFSTGTMDRVQVPGEISTAKTMARMLSSTPPQCRVEIVIYDIHALQEWHYFEKNVVVRLQSAIPLLKDQLKHLSDIAIAFPDEGARKRFGNMFGEFPQIVCEKNRNGDEREVRIVSGDPTDKHVVIVDDLVMTGGTLLKCAEALENRGACAVSAYVTHGVFPKESWRHFTEGNGARFSNFWITNSCPTMSVKLAGVKPFRVLSLAPLIGAMIRKDCYY